MGVGQLSRNGIASVLQTRPHTCLFTRGTCFRQHELLMFQGDAFLPHLYFTVWDLGVL